jgi:hypothetical protein
MVGLGPKGPLDTLHHNDRYIRRLYLKLMMQVSKHVLATDEELVTLVWYIPERRETLIIWPEV